MRASRGAQSALLVQGGVFVVARGLPPFNSSEAVMAVAREGDRLTVTMTDDGRGGADVNAGPGIRGLVGRVEALGGRLTVTSAARGGTAIRAELPLR